MRCCHAAALPPTRTASGMSCCKRAADSRTRSRSGARRFLAMHAVYLVIISDNKLGTHHYRALALSSGTSNPRDRPGRFAGETMKRPYRSALVATLAPAVLLAATFTVHAAQPSSATRWSDPASWPNRKVPAAGEKVTIAKDKEVILDVSTPALAGLSIDGKLTFADN